MKILLLNDNPVVTKLVTLSAQKTDNEVEAAHSVEEVPAGEYDLLVIDDALYNKESFAALKEKVHFKKSLFVCSRDNDEKEEFSATIKKPFLPTDMVELFTNIKRNLDAAPEADISEEEIEDISDEELLDGLELEGLDGLEDLDSDLEDDLILDDDEFADEEELGESVLDDEEAEKVKALLDETQDDTDDEEIALNAEYDLALDLEDEADVDISEPEEDLDLKELGIESDEELEDIDFDEEIDLDLAELELEGEADLEEVDEEQMLEIDEEEFSDENLETQIQDAVEELSDEDLQSEVDEETLLEIATNEIDSFANLNSKDLKAALGEESEDEAAEEDEAEIEEEELTQEIQESDPTANKGVESLKTLLKALSDENVAASLKGAKITINISFED